MADGGIAKVFWTGRSQAVRLPREFRVQGDQVRVRRVGRGILLEPLYGNARDWFAAMDRRGDGPFMEEGRNQPPMPEAEDLFE